MTFFTFKFFIGTPEKHIWRTAGFHAHNCDEAWEKADEYAYKLEAYDFQMITE